MHLHLITTRLSKALNTIFCRPSTVPYNTFSVWNRVCVHACVRVCASYLSYLFSFLVLLQKTSMASEQSSKVFTCPVCLCSNHYPTTLQCLHYICIDCIKKEDAKHPGFVECPFCDMKVPVRHFYQKQQSELCENNTLWTVWAGLLQASPLGKISLPWLRQTFVSRL